MNLQISLLVLGVLAIVAIYFFSQWQEKKRRTHQSIHGTQSSDRKRRDSDSNAPAFERSEPGFGPGSETDHSGPPLASMDRHEPPFINDYLDADSSTESLESSGYEEEIETGQQSVSPSGISTPIESDVEEITDDFDDIPTLENIVHPSDVAATFESAPSVESETDLGDRFVGEVDVLTEMVEISQHNDEDLPVDEDAGLEDAVNIADVTIGQEQSFLDAEPESVPIEEVTASDEYDLEIPVLMESEVVIPESFDQSSLIENASSESIELGYGQSDEHDIDDVELDPEEEYAEARPSLKAFLSSIGPINKLKTNIQNQLDSVKAERERAHSGIDRELENKPDVVIETDFAIHTESTSNAVAPSDNSGAEELIASGHEFVIDVDNDVTVPDLSAEPQLTQSASTVAVPTIPVEIADNNNDEAVDVMESDKTPTQVNAVAPEFSPAEGFDKLSQIDYYVKLSGERDVSRDSVLAIYRDGAAGISRTHSIYGLRLPEKVWRDLEHESEDARFGDLVVTIQLVDESGLVTENEMTRFSSLIMKLSESTGRGFSFMAPIENAHRQAQAIDRFKQKFDSIFVVNIRPMESEMFEGAVIERCAKQIGLTADDNQFFARYKPVGKQKVCLYSLANMSDTGEFDLENMRAVRTRGVTFFTRPAINRSPGAVFAEMVDAAKAFASRIKGEVIAPGYEDLSTDDVEAIRRSIEKVATEMESYGINPGSEEATRLFG